MKTAKQCIDSHTPCMYHRYHVVHVKPDSEEVYDHSQSTWDTKLRGIDGIESIPSFLFEHEMTASELRSEFDLYKAQKAKVI